MQEYNIFCRLKTVKESIVFESFLSLNVISLSMPKAEFKSDDDVREAILYYLYNAWNNPRGMDSHRLKISQITSDLKKMRIEKKYVVRNLLYLIETDWVKEEVKESQYFTGKMSIPTETKTYRISKDGIDYFESSSKFQKSNRFTGINISDIKNSVIVLGDNNFVRNEYKELYDSLDDLGRHLRMSSEISDDDKINYQADLDTIKAQLIKPKPDGDIVGKAWNALKAVATINGVVSCYTKVAPLIQALLHH